MKNEPGFLRWTPAEWQKVAAYAVPYTSKGLPPNVALMKAQRLALPKPRWRDEDSMRRIVWAPQTKKYLEAAAALPADMRAELAPPPPPRKPPAPRPKQDEGRNYGGDGQIVRWTTLEKARIARQVNLWRAEGDTRALSRLVIEAQELVIDPDRRRPVLSIQAGVTGGHNERLMEEGTRHQWVLDTAEAKLKPAPNDVVEAAAPAAPAAAEPPPAETPPPSPAAAPQDAAADPPPLPHTPAPRAMSEAAKAFGETVMGALDKLLAVHTETLLSSVYARISAAAAETSKQIAAHIEREMRETVHKIVEAELGGPVNPPSAGEAAPAAPDPQDVQAHPIDVPRPAQIKVDVVGLIGHQLTEVRKAFNGNTDLRFVDADHVTNWVPNKGRHTVFVTKFISHDAEFKLRAAGIKPIRVNGAAATVIRAIEELHRSHGVPT